MISFHLSTVARSVGGKQGLIWIAQITQQLFECFEGFLWQWTGLARRPGIIP